MWSFMKLQDVWDLNQRPFLSASSQVKTKAVQWVNIRKDGYTQLWRNDLHHVWVPVIQHYLQKLYKNAFVFQNSFCLQKRMPYEINAVKATLNPSSDVFTIIQPNDEIIHKIQQNNVRWVSHSTFLSQKNTKSSGKNQTLVWWTPSSQTQFVPTPFQPKAWLRNVLHTNCGAWKDELLVTNVNLPKHEWLNIPDHHVSTTLLDN